MAGPSVRLTPNTLLIHFPSLPGSLVCSPQPFWPPVMQHSCHSPSHKPYKPSSSSKPHNRTSTFKSRPVSVMQTPQANPSTSPADAASLPLLVGLTGGIGQGKSTVSGFLTAQNVPVLCADAVVHKLYAAGGAAVAPVGAVFPDAVVAGAIDRPQLSKYVVGNEAAMKQLEGIVHPLVEAERLQFVQQVCARFPKPLEGDGRGEEEEGEMGGGSKKRGRGGGRARENPAGQQHTREGGGFEEGGTHRLATRNSLRPWWEQTDCSLCGRCVHGCFWDPGGGGAGALRMWGGWGPTGSTTAYRPAPLRCCTRPFLRTYCASCRACTQLQPYRLLSPICSACSMQQPTLQWLCSTYRC